MNCSPMQYDMRLTPRIVAELGLGKDIWNVDPDNITKILYVRLIWF